MRYLSQGQEDKRIVIELLGLTRLGENMQEAIIDHLTRGFSISCAASISSIKSNNLSVAIKDLNKIAARVERINELKTYGISHTKLTGK